MRLRRFIAALLLTVMTGCTTVGPVANPREFIPIRRPSRVWLTRSDGSVMLMYRPTLEGDTLSGVVLGQGLRKILRTDIKSVEAVVPATDRTRLVMIGGGALVAVGMFWAIRHTGIFSVPPPECVFDDDQPCAWTPPPK